MGPLHALRLIGVLVPYVMNFMAGVKPLQYLQSPDLSAPGGRVEKVTLDPEDSHAVCAALADTGMRPSQNCSRRPVRYMSPQTCKFRRRQIRSVAS